MRGRPELQSKPVCVCWSNSNEGAGEISSANYPARAFGIRAGKRNLPPQKMRLGSRLLSAPAQRNDTLAGVARVRGPCHRETGAELRKLGAAQFRNSSWRADHPASLRRVSCGSLHRSFPLRGRCNYPTLHVKPPRTRLSWAVASSSARGSQGVSTRLRLTPMPVENVRPSLLRGEANTTAPRTTRSR
jgi:hypothetical protein